MNVDPFYFKQYSRYHPARLLHEANARLMEQIARIRFDSLELPMLEKDVGAIIDFNEADTAVTPVQLSAIIYYASKSLSLGGSSIVEVGCYRGITTAQLARATKKTIYAIDPFIGYGGSELDYEIFRRNTNIYNNIVHIRDTSGSAASRIKNSSASFIFIDAVHDYANTAHDIRIWQTKLVPGGYLALHDTDNRTFAGTRMAASRASKHLPIVYHTRDLLILKRAT